MTIEFELNDDDGNGTVSGTDEDMSFIYGQGVAYMLIKGINDLTDEDVVKACRMYTELKKQPVVAVEDVADAWAYWTPGDIK
jgi:hypothetical protein